VDYKLSGGAPLLGPMVRLLEHRRHSRRSPGGVHLTREGVALARRVGEGLGPFDRVVTSPSPRAIETAVAMGYAVDAELRGLLAVPDAVDRDLAAHPPTSFSGYLDATLGSGATRAFAERQEALWRSELLRLPDGGRLLAISHGGVIEFGTAIAAPEAARGFGSPLGYVEGVRLQLEGDRWTSAEVLRVAAGAMAALSRAVTSSGEPSASTDRREPRAR
jgi:broad specificity phosphatase PhoE